MARFSLEGGKEESCDESKAFFTQPLKDVA
jgi:hypothetical protein